MTKLLIVESPAKSKTIEKYLGSNYQVLSSVGHIRDIPKSASKKANAVDIENGFKPRYEISQGKEKVVAQLKAAAKNADEIIIATDPDREGEAIAWHIKEALGLDEDEYTRVTFNEITKEAVVDALKKPRKIDYDLKTAQEARRILDRLFGYGLSGLVWKKVRYGLSAGRVQSPALRILAERERMIQAFNPDTYWTIAADTKTESGKLVTLSYKDDVWKQEEMENIQKLAEKAGEFLITSIKETEANRKPKAPFTTSTLQQAASNRLGYSPAKTMRAAQKLYEGGHITYMRTDSPTLSKASMAQIADYIGDEYGKEYHEAHVYKSRSKNAQEAHEAVRPTSIHTEKAGTTDDQKKLYELIWKRTIASQMTPAKTLRTKVIAEVEGADIDHFAVSGSRLIYDGWLRAFPEAAGDDTLLPKMKEGEKMRLLQLTVEEKETSPPSRYTEAGLVKELEKRGIGRPSTYASTIKTVIDRQYVDKEGRTLFPTDLGMVISGFLEEHFTDYISDTFTAKMEDDLDLMSVGKKDYVELLQSFYDPFTKALADKADIEKITNLGPVEGNFTCPECDADMMWKLGRGGKFMSCTKFPECAGARTDEGKVLEGPKEIGEMCPECGEDHKDGKLVMREGRYGMFISCARYPKCKFIKEDEETKKANSTGVACTECKDGEMTKKVGRFGEFYSCSNYPDCKMAIKAKPTGELCPICQALMMEGTKTIPERCSIKTCPMHRPDKMEKEVK